MLKYVNCWRPVFSSYFWRYTNYWNHLPTLFEVEVWPYIIFSTLPEKKYIMKSLPLSFSFHFFTQPSTLQHPSVLSMNLSQFIPNSLSSLLSLINYFVVPSFYFWSRTIFTRPIVRSSRPELFYCFSFSAESLKF